MTSESPSSSASHQNIVHVSQFGSIDDVSVSPNGRFFAVASTAFEGNQWGGGLELIRPHESDPDDGNSDDNVPAQHRSQLLAFEKVCSTDLECGVSSVCWTGDITLACGTDEGEVRVYQLSDLPKRHSSDHPPSPTKMAENVNAEAEIQKSPPPLPPAFVYAGIRSDLHDDCVNSVACSPICRNFVVSGGRDATVRRWDVTREESVSCGATSFWFDKASTNIPMLLSTMPMRMPPFDLCNWFVPAY